MKTVRIMTCDNLQQAYVLKGRLANEGIESVLSNENFTSMVPMYNNMLGGGIQIIVKEEDASKAAEILKDEISPDNENIVCPNCGSKNIALGLGKKKGITIFTVLLSVFSALPMGNLKPKYYCRDCGKEIK